MGVPVPACFSKPMICSSVNRSGPVNAPITVAGKLFAGLYPLYCGLAVIFVAGLLLAPLLHRFLHKFHLVHVPRE